MNLGTDLHTLVLFDRNGRECYRGPETRDTTRPALGASYLIEPETELKFRPYRRDHFAIERRRCESPGRAHMNRAEIIAAARRFEADGEMDNAHNMLSLLS